MGRASWPLTRLILRNKLMLHGEYEQTNYNKITKSSMLRSTFDFIGIILKNQPLVVFYFFNFLSQPISSSSLVGSDTVIGWPKPLPGNQGSWFSVSNLFFSKQLLQADHFECKEIFFPPDHNLQIISKKNMALIGCDIIVN